MKEKHMKNGVKKNTASAYGYISEKPATWRAGMQLA
jgi:hypothetical protein